MYSEHLGDKIVTVLQTLYINSTNRHADLDLRCFQKSV